MGERMFSRVQYGKESPSAKGTAVAATRYFLGQSQQIAPDRKPTYPVEQFGVRAESLRSVVHQYLFNGSLQSEHGYFQALPMIFSGGLKGGLSPSEVTPAQGDYLWTHTPSMTAIDAVDAFTIEMGDDTQAYEAEFCEFERIKISGQVAQAAEASPVNIAADFYGRQLTATTFTGAISLPTVEPMNAKLARLYVDTAWAGIGGTEKAGILRAFDIEIITGRHPKFHGSANKYFSGSEGGPIGVMANFTLEGNSDADAAWDTFMANTFAAVRLQINGSVIGSGTPHSLKIDIGGTWESVVPLGGEDKGNNLHTATLHGFYEATGAKMLQVAVVTNQATV